MENIPKMYLFEEGIIVDGQTIGGPFFLLKERYPNLKGRALAIGLIGARGSGKSTAAARMGILEYLLKKRKVWSNMPIAVDLMTKSGIVPLRTEPVGKLDLLNLDRRYQNGCLLVDEVGIDYAEARRAMSNDNLKFTHWLAQIRKRDMDVIWTAQSEAHVEDRLRFQTDIIIKCKDLSLSKPGLGVGELSQWEIYDYSGMIKGTLQFAKLPESPVIWNKPWWHVFDTAQMQIKDSGYSQDDGLEDKAALIANLIKADAEKRIMRQIAWIRARVFNRSERQRISELLLANYHIITSRDSRYYQIADLAAIGADG